MMAAWHGNLKLAKTLLEHGVPVNQADFQGETALIL
jgi:ankyrin repeat protein